MVNEQLISHTVPLVTPSDTGVQALSIMESNHLLQIPLVEEEKYVALLQEQELLDWKAADSALSEADFSNYRPAVVASGHPFEALRVAHSQNISVLPVVDNENNYLGAITSDDLLGFFAESTGIDNPGGILVLEIKPADYSLAQIARVCEQEDTIIISTHLFSNPDTGLLELTIKTNRSDLQGLVSSFERYKFSVKEVHGGRTAQDDSMDRYKLLMNYINM